MCRLWQWKTVSRSPYPLLYRLCTPFGVSETQMGQEDGPYRNAIAGKWKKYESGRERESRFFISSKILFKNFFFFLLCFFFFQTRSVTWKLCMLFFCLFIFSIPGYTITITHIPCNTHIRIYQSKEIKCLVISYTRLKKSPTD